MNKKVISSFFTLVFVLLVSLSLSGCWTSVKGSHPLLQKNSAIPHASVYFIRPRTERMMGMADNRVTVSLDRLPLVELVKGEYTLALLQPGKTWISIDNQTTFGPAHRVKPESRNRPFTFAAGKTYYIAIEPVDGEFRGVYFLPRELSFTEAQAVTRHMRAVGDARGNSIPEAAS